VFGEPTKTGQTKNIYRKKNKKQSRRGVVVNLVQNRKRQRGMGKKNIGSGRG